MTRNGKWKTYAQDSVKLSDRGATNWESQEAFADLCGLDRTYLGGIERGERNVALVNIEKIARALRISLDELFRGV